jgi:hypothetical protein
LGTKIWRGILPSPTFKFVWFDIFKPKKKQKKILTWVNTFWQSMCMMVVCRRISLESKRKGKTIPTMRLAQQVTYTHTHTERLLDK